MVAEGHLEALGVGRCQAPLDEELRVTPVVGVDLSGDRARPIDPRPSDRAVCAKKQLDPFDEPRRGQRPAQAARVPHRRPGPARDILHEGHIGQAGERPRADPPHISRVGVAVEARTDCPWPLRPVPLPILPLMTFRAAIGLRDGDRGATATRGLSPQASVPGFPCGMSEGWAQHDRPAYAEWTLLVPDHQWSSDRGFRPSTAARGHP